jgi:hypothetical protein
METKKFECDAGLEYILKQVGFQDYTKKFDRDRGKSGYSARLDQAVPCALDQ